MTSRTGSDEADPQAVSIAVRKAQTKADRRRTIVACIGGLVVASAVIAAMMLASGPTSSAMATDSPSPTMAGDMPGMDHGSSAMPATSPTPTMASDMPGMDHGSSAMPETSPTPTMAGDSPWKTHDHGDTKSHDHGTAAGVAPGRPLAPVLGTFGGGTSAVLLSAGFLRRRDHARCQAKAAARAARRTQR
jgi:hypothetical protein